jgi:hypothetical protein
MRCSFITGHAEIFLRWDGRTRAVDYARLYIGDQPGQDALRFDNGRSADSADEQIAVLRQHFARHGHFPLHPTSCSSSNQPLKGTPDARS